MTVLKGQTNKQGGNQIVWTFGKEAFRTLNKANIITEKEVRIMGNKFFGLLAPTANKCGFGMEKGYSGGVYKINVVIPEELRATFNNHENLIEIKIDLGDLNQSILQLESSAEVKGSQTRKLFFLAGYLQGFYESLTEAISLMEKGPVKKPKLIK